MKSRAAIAWEAGKPLEVDMVDLEGPKTGEVLIRNVATGVCHTDAFTLSGEDPEGIFPSILGHEGGAVVEEIGKGVSSVKVGDHVIPLYVPECGECQFCKSGKTNLCQSIRLTQGKGLMPDGTSRFFVRRKNLVSLHGNFDIFRIQCFAANFGRQNQYGSSLGKSVFARLRDYYRNWCGFKYRKSGSWSDGGSVWVGRCWAWCNSGCCFSQSQTHHCRGHQ